MIDSSFRLYYKNKKTGNEFMGDLNYDTYAKAKAMIDSMNRDYGETHHIEVIMVFKQEQEQPQRSLKLVDGV